MSIPKQLTQDQFEDHEDMKDRICDDSSWETNSDNSPKDQDELEPGTATTSGDFAAKSKKGRLQSMGSFIAKRDELLIKDNKEPLNEADEFILENHNDKDDLIYEQEEIDDYETYL